MAWLLDTNAWITYLKTPQSSIRSRLQSLQPTDVVLCSVVKAELLHGAEKYGNRERRLGLLRELFAPYASHPFDDAALRCGRSRPPWRGQSARPDCAPPASVPDRPAPPVAQCQMALLEWLQRRSPYRPVPQLQLHA